MEPGETSTELNRSFLWADYLSLQTAPVVMGLGVAHRGLLRLHNSSYLEKNLRFLASSSGMVARLSMFNLLAPVGAGVMMYNAARSSVRLIFGMSEDVWADLGMLGGAICGVTSVLGNLHPHLRKGIAALGICLDAIDIIRVGWSWNVGQATFPDLALQLGLTWMFGFHHSNWVDPNRLMAEVRAYYPDANLFSSAHSVVMRAQPTGRITSKEFAQIVIRRVNGMVKNIRHDISHSGHSAANQLRLAPFMEEGYFRNHAGSHDSALALLELVRRARSNGIDLVKDARRWDPREGQQFPDHWQFLEAYFAREVPQVWRVSYRQVASRFDHYFPGMHQRWLSAEAVIARSAEIGRFGVGGPTADLDWSLPETTEGLVKLLRDKWGWIAKRSFFETETMVTDTRRWLVGDRDESRQLPWVRNLFHLTDEIEGMGIRVIGPEQMDKIARLRIETEDLHRTLSQPRSS